MILISQYGGPTTMLPREDDNRDNIHPYPHEMNITDGSEFLDDAIRTKDQPLGSPVTSEVRGLSQSSEVRSLKYEI